MSTTTAERPRVLVPEDAAPPRRSLPEGLARAVVAGGEAALLGWLAVTIPTVAAYVATATAPALGNATWVHAATVGSSLWRLAHGGVVTLAGIQITLAPLGLGCLAVLLVLWSARRAVVRTWSALGALVLGYAVPATVLASLPETGVGGWPGTAAGACAIALLGAGLSRRGRGLPPAPPRLEALLARLDDGPRAVLGEVGGAALRGSAAALVGLLLVGVGVLGLAIGAQHEAVVSGYRALAPDGMSLGMLLAGSVLYLPTLLIWAVAWAAGPGFAIGSGSLVSPAAVQLGALPAFPPFAALPTTGAAPWAPVVVVGVGAAVGWRLHRRDGQERLWASAATAVGAAAIAALGVIALAGAASGGIGPGRMVELGPRPWPVAAWSALWLAVGALAVVVAARPDSRALSHRVAAAVGAWAAGQFGRAPGAARVISAVSTVAALPGRATAWLRAITDRVRRLPHDVRVRLSGRWLPRRGLRR